MFLDFRKVVKFAASVERPKANPDPLTGALPLDPDGGSAPDPSYRLALRACHGLPPTFKYLPRSLTTNDNNINNSRRQIAKVSTSLIT